MAKKQTGKSRATEVNPDHFEMSEQNENFKKSVIARTNLTNHFTIENIEAQQAQLEKMERELEAQLKVTGGVLDNVKRNHPGIFALTEEMLAIAAYLHENRRVFGESKKKLAEVKEHLGHYENVLKVIYDKFGFVESEVTEETDGGEEK